MSVIFTNPTRTKSQDDIFLEHITSLKDLLPRLKDVNGYRHGLAHKVTPKRRKVGT